MGATSIEAGRAFMRLLVDNKEFAKGLDEGLRQLDNFGKGAQKIGTAIGGIGAAITAPFVASLKIFSDTGSALADMQSRTGLSAKALSQLKFAAEQSGTSLEVVEKAARELQDQGIDPNKIFDYAKKIAAIEDPTQRAQAAFDLFGKKAGAALLPVLEKLPELADKSERLRLTWSQKMVDAADNFGDALDAVKSQLGAVAAAVGASIAPALTKLAELLQGSLATLIDYIHGHEALLRVIFVVGASLTAAGLAIVAFGTAARAATLAVEALNLALKALAKNPWTVAITVALSIITYLLSPLIDKWLGLTDANDKAEDAAKKLASAQNQLKDSMADGTAEVDARTEALKRLHAEEDRRARDAQILAETRRQEEREAFLGQRLLPGDRGRSLEAQAIKRVIDKARERLSELESDNAGKQLVDIGAQSEMDGLRTRIRQLEGALGNLRSQSSPGLLASESGAFPSLFMPGFNLALNASLRAAFDQTGRQERQGLRGFGTMPQKDINDFEREMRPILSTFNGRLAGQIFGGNSDSRVDRLVRAAEKTVTKLDKLEDIDKNLKLNRFRNDLA